MIKALRVIVSYDPHGNENSVEFLTIAKTPKRALYNLDKFFTPSFQTATFKPQRDLTKDEYETMRVQKLVKIEHVTQVPSGTYLTAIVNVYLY